MKLTYWELIGIIFIAGIGVFLHYAFELSDYNQFIALIAPVNESLWEHLKMAFYGMVIYALVEYIFVGHTYKNFIFAKALSSLLACFLVAVLYYGYTSFLDPKLYLDIIIFVVAIIIAQLISLGILKSKFYIKGLNYIGLLALFLTALLFASFTYDPPTDQLFKELLSH
ncbi:MAG TPA: DUF6512 family protein [Haloplasmataceae bacterium]